MAARLRRWKRIGVLAQVGCGRGPVLLRRLSELVDGRSQRSCQCIFPDRSLLRDFPRPPISSRQIQSAIQNNFSISETKSVLKNSDFLGGVIAMFTNLVGTKAPDYGKELAKLISASLPSRL